MAPSSLAEPYDNPGLQIGSRRQAVRRILVGLELSPRLLSEARRRRCDTVLVHHPLFFLPVKRLLQDELVGGLALAVARARLTLIAAHTNLDKSPEGTGPALAAELGLRHTEVLLPERLGEDVKFVVFVPAGHETKVIEAIHRGGGGVIGEYDHCSFRAEGTGSFRGSARANPAVGQAGRLEQVREFRLESLVPRRALASVLDAVRRVHPYEEMAFDVYPLEPPLSPFGLGLRATLERPMTLRAWAAHVKRRLRLRSVRMVGDPRQRIRHVALATGACEFLVRDLAPPHIDCLVTGDVKYHLAVEARAKGLGVVDPGHWASEVIVCEPWARALHRRLTAKGWSVDVFAATENDPDPFVAV